MRRQSDRCLLSHGQVYGRGHRQHRDHISFVGGRGGGWSGRQLEVPREVTVRQASVPIAAAAAGRVPSVTTAPPMREHLNQLTSVPLHLHAAIVRLLSAAWWSTDTEKETEWQETTINNQIPATVAVKTTIKHQATVAGGWDDATAMYSQDGTSNNLTQLGKREKIISWNNNQIELGQQDNTLIIHLCIVNRVEMWEMREWSLHHTPNRQSIKQHIITQLIHIYYLCPQ
jgi:hypothetical protein